METIKTKLNSIFQDIFDNKTLQINESMTANDVPGWDSITHITLIVAVEKAFKVSLTTKEVNSLRNVGDLIQILQRKIM